MKKIGFLMALMIISSCSFGQKSKKVAYTIGKNYFVTGTVDAGIKDDGVRVFPKITTEKEFEKLFGMATLMGINGQPTAIDFSKQYVIAVINSASNRHDALDPISLTKLGDQITFTFSKKEATKGSAQFRSYIILIVDNKNDGEISIKDTAGTEYIPYTLANRYFVKNTIENKAQVLTITNEGQFNNYFGMATVMGEDGQPTPIDFTKQIAIAVISKSSEDEVKYTFNLTKKEEITTVTYQTEGGKPGDSYRYCAIVIIDKKYEKNIIIENK